ncbi:hypothetical protein EXW34_31250 (plasmid) [Bacillus mycoides]|uniref:hypothetical protein n=1 Tax=Bacillus mycoides TaxID=1405 RepID=UPI001C01BCF5|nr:hypothetical protein [Bacillus mycoides]QWI25649.1 hypothetical protein EXW34_31250 [Bacillus mycoides]
MEMWSIEQIENASLQELIQFLKEKKACRKPFDLEFEEIDSDLYFSNEITFNHIQDLFHLDVENRKYIYPRGDERELYQEKFMGHAKLPVKGFFWVLSTEMKEQPLGFVDLLFTVSRVGIKSNDRRFPDSRFVIRDEKKFMYDFKEDMYMQINVKSKHENTQAYNERQGLLTAINKRLQGEFDSYLERLNAMATDIKKYKGTNTKDIKFYYVTIEDWFEENLKFLDIALQYDHIDEGGHRHLHERVTQQRERMQQMINEMDKIEGLFKGETVDFLGHTNNEVLLKTFESSNALLDSIRRLFKQRDYNEMDKYNLDPKQCDWGYYDWDNERLYFNFVEMQTRRFYQNHAESWDSKMKEEEQLLVYLKEKRAKV